MYLIEIPLYLPCWSDLRGLVTLLSCFDGLFNGVSHYKYMSSLRPEVPHPLTYPNYERMCRTVPVNPVNKTSSSLRLIFSPNSPWFYSLRVPVSTLASATFAR